MKCEDVSKELIPYLDRRANSALRLEIEDHLAGCAACHARAEDFRKVSTALDEVPLVEPSLGFDARLRQRIVADTGPRWFRWLVPQPRLAFSMALLLVLSVWMAKLPQTRPGDLRGTDFEAVKDLNVLENYDVLSKFDALSELAPIAVDQPAQADQNQQQPPPADGGGDM